MPDVEMNLIVLRTPRLDEARAFYSALGVDFVDEQHGTGPAHCSATFRSGLVLELYPSVDHGALAPGGAGDVRLGFTVDDLAEAVHAATATGGTVVSQRDDGAVVADPDGRKVELSLRVPRGG